MAAFLSHDLQELTRQLGYAPPQRRRRHLDNAERLYWNVAPERNYPLDFVVYQITGYRPDASGEEPTLVGEALRLDLLLFVERLSESLDDRAEDYDPPPWDLNGLSRHLGVSIKTLHRYRRQGLFARRFRFSGGRRRLGFLHESVERFLESRPGRIRRAGRFSRIDEPTRHRIITRARRIAGRVPISAHRVARHLGRKHDRSTETIRQLLLRHDRRDPRTAIFPDHTPPLSDKQQRIIHRAYHRGVSVARLVERFGKGRNAIYRALNRRRAKALRELNLRYVYSPTFDLPEADEVILGAASSAEPDEVPTTDHDAATPSSRRSAQAPPDPSDGLSPYLRQLYDQPLLDAQTEKALFARYNYLKYRAAGRRDQLDRYQPRAGRLDQIETDLRRAVAAKQRLVRSNLRLVVSVARKHLGAQRSADTQTMADLVSEGNLVLLEAIEHFDAGRGNRFSTYLTWALMRRFAQSGRPTAAPLAADARGGEYWPASLNPNVAAMEQAEEVTHTLARLLAELDSRERLIITRHFGLDDGADQPEEPQTLAQLAEELQISAERARQIEHRAIQKLRDAADRLGLPLPRTDGLPTR